MQIRWDLVSETVPAFLTIAVMPLTYSIAYGAATISAGCFFYKIFTEAQVLLFAA